LTEVAHTLSSNADECVTEWSKIIHCTRAPVNKITSAQYALSSTHSSSSAARWTLVN